MQRYFKQERPQMKRFILTTLTISIMIGLSGCTDSPEDSLQESLNKYKKCVIENDFKCQAKLLDPAPFEEMGSNINDALEGLKSSGVKIIDIQMKTPTKITKNGSTLISTIETSTTIKIKEKEIKSEDLLQAASTDNGSTWLFSSKR